MSRCRLLFFRWLGLSFLLLISGQKNSDDVNIRERRSVAVVTLLTTSAYVPGAEVLAYSLDSVNATGDRVLLYVGGEEDARSDLHEEHIDGLRHAGWNRIIPLTRESNTYTECKVLEKNRQQLMATTIKRYWGTCSKIAIWTLTDYDAVVYIDADSLVLNNFDFVYNYILEGPGDSLFAQGTPGCWETPPNCDSFYSAFLVVKPSHHIQQYFHNIAKENELINGDIELLNAVYKNWKPLPRYTLVAQTEQARPRNPETNEVDWSHVKVYDFSGAPATKPWVTYEIQRSKKDKYAHEVFSNVEPGSDIAETYMHPQWLWNEFYEAVLENRKKNSIDQTQPFSVDEL